VHAGAVTLTEAGLYVPEVDLHLDPHAPVRRAFVSHAHADHAAGLASGEVYGSPETLALLATRARAPLAGARPIAWDGAAELAGAHGTVRLTLQAAGHVLGAAQLVVDRPSGRLAYTGDYRSGSGRTHATGSPVRCDELVLESTFALPIFRWPDRAATVAEVVAFCRAALLAGETPVLLAWALGKAQELCAELVHEGLSVVAHGAVLRMCEAYEALGVPVGVAAGGVTPYARWKEASAGKGRARREPREVLILPPHDGPRMLRSKDARASRVALVSGWAVIDAQLEQRRAEAGFALSDHADTDDLVATARASGARRVVTVHGDAAALARVLSLAGIEATALDTPALDVLAAASDASEATRGTDA